VILGAYLCLARIMDGTRPDLDKLKGCALLFIGVIDVMAHDLPHLCI
jgi:hypothetical protein